MRMNMTLVYLGLSKASGQANCPLPSIR